ncbi:UPF0175 family protein [Candidatus Woesearchaeota archaeon]|nr:UPF0175 family protein [Candidatus Woesearchaeota archaeon]
MSEAIGIRLDDEILRKVDIVSREEYADRSTIIRKLLTLGLNEITKRKTAQAYREGRITLSEAAHKAGLTLWDFQHYLVDMGFVSSYSIEDINEELELLKKKHR